MLGLDSIESFWFEWKTWIDPVVSDIVCFLVSGVTRRLISHFGVSFLKEKLESLNSF